MNYDFHKRLKELRMRSGISQKELAKQMGVTRTTINSWESGISFPNAYSLTMLSEYFYITTDYLLGMDDSELLNISDLDENEKNMIYDMVKLLTDIKKKNKR
ncbi:MAG: helix-turn-helix transcriptional regulator [Clostridia bacterium]|nr:helix-turn-helix transcriptional regulator [Clostridia bacterium]